MEFHTKGEGDFNTPLSPKTGHAGCPIHSKKINPQSNIRAK